MTTVQQPEITTERVAIIVYLLGKGHKFRTADIAQLCGVTRQGAYGLMVKISRVAPIVLENGEWSEINLRRDASTPR